MGLKAGVLALMAGLALYPKISAEAEVVEREMRMKRERKDVFRRENRERERERARSSGRGRREDRERERYGDRERDRYREGERGGDGRKVMRVDEYDIRRGEGYREREAPRERGSGRSSGRSRTQDWVEGGYEYLNANDYQERDRRRW